MQVETMQSDCTGGACLVGDFNPVKQLENARAKLPRITLSLVIERGESVSIIQPRDVAKYLRFLCSSSEERFIAIHLNAHNEVIGLHEVSHGTLTASLVHPREIFKAAMLANSHSILVAHNHPSGSELRPSGEDIEVTKQLIAAGKMIGVNVIDHVIVGPVLTDWYSIREESPYLWAE